MQFSFFVLLTAILLLRPADIIPPLMGLPLYQGVILVCIALSLGNILQQITIRSLLAHAISFCMVGLLVAILMSHLSHLQLELATESGDYFFRVCLFYFLLVATLDTPERLRRYLFWLLVLVLVLTALPLLQYHGMIDLPGLEAIIDRDDDVNIEAANSVQRLCGPGIFNDPNDLCLILVFGILLSVYFRDTSKRGLGRLLYLSPVPVFLYALTLTRSRGGLLTLVSGLLGYFASRLGFKKAFLAILVCAPLGMFLFSGRQTNIGLSGGTSHERINLWREGMVLLKQYPLFGTGMNTYADHMGLVAHNSFVHAYVELGFLGGSLFVTIFAFSLRNLHALQKDFGLGKHDDLCGYRNLLTGAFSSFAVGFFSLSRVYFVPSYLLFGLATSYFNLIEPERFQPGETVDSKAVLRYFGISVGALIALNLFMKFAP